jgi:hypothetical protein
MQVISSQPEDALGRFAFRLTLFFDEHHIRVVTILGTAILSATIGEDPIA